MVEINRRLLNDMQRTGMVRDGHFEFRSGHHSACTLDRDRLLSYPDFASHLGYVIAKQFFTSVIETVATPSMWGAALAQWVGYFLQPRATVVFARPDNGGFQIPLTLVDAVQGRRVLLIDNLVISGETMRRFAADVTDRGGEIIGIGTLWNTAGAPVPNLPIFSLFNARYPVYAPDACPLCARGVPVEMNPFSGWEQVPLGRGG